jgi:hypothetical protein
MAKKDIKPAIISGHFPNQPDTEHTDQPCNWRSTLSGSAAISGALAGFSVAFIGLLVSGSFPDLNIGFASLTFGQVALLLFGIAVALLVGAAEFLIRALGFDVYGLSPLTPGVKLVEGKTIFDDTDYVSEQNRLLQRNYGIARSLYNIAIFLVFGGLLFSIWPYKNWIAAIVFVAGIIVEVTQVSSTRNTHS